MLTSVAELDSRPRDQRRHYTRDQQLARPRLSHHSSGDVDGYATDIVTHHLHFTGVKAGSDLDPESPNSFTERQGTPNGPTRTVESGEHSVAGGLDHPATMLVHDRLREPKVSLQDIAPPAVTERGGLFRRTNDVGEEDRGKGTIAAFAWRHAGQEPFDLIEDLRGRLEVGVNAASGDDDEAGIGNVVCEILPAF
jgi:hypothetical protein